MLREAQRRNNSKIDFLSSAFPEQRAFIEDKSRLKGALCTRRAAKSFTVGLHLFKDAHENPGVTCGYIALTRMSAKAIMWKDVLKPINHYFKVGAEFNESELSIKLPNGSIIFLAGADAKPDDMYKFLGQKFKSIFIDEGGHWRQDLRELVYGILRPGTADHQGTIGIIGTPSNISAGLFYDLTHDSVNVSRDGWSIHSWDTYANPYMKENWDREIKELVADNPHIEETPRFRQMYKKEWVKDLDAIIYKFDSTRNLIDKLPEAKYDTVLGVDLGWEDATAFVISKYSQFDKNLYITESIKKSKMDLFEVAEKIKELDVLHSFNYMIVDGANKQGVETMKSRWNLPLISTEKTGKADHMELMNSDLITGRIKLIKADTETLQTEWRELIWDPRALLLGKRKEHPSCDNHLSDAALYSWRYCYNYLSESKDEFVAPTSEGAIDSFWEKQAKQLSDKRDRNIWEEDHYTDDDFDEY